MKYEDNLISGMQNMSQSSQSAKATARAPRLRRGHERVTRLLDAAASVFVEHGYDAATMTEVAAHAGASIGSLYQFFPTKPLLAEALHVRELEALAAVLDDGMAVVEARSGTLAEVADRLLAALLDFARTHPAFPVLAERRDIDPVRKAGTRRQMLEQLARLLAQAEPPPSVQQSHTAAALVLLMMKSAVSLLHSGDMPEASHLIDEIREMLSKHLASLPPGDAP
jgi:AcrR family transcriptional regulator